MRDHMKTFVKTACIAAVALAMTTFGTFQAGAGGWAVAGGVVGGLAVGTAVGATIATAAAQPAYYPYGPAYCAPAPVVVAGPGFYGGPRFYPYRPYVRYGWGPRAYRGHPYWRR